MEKIKTEENYKGHRISTVWSNRTMGYKFCILNENGTEGSYSSESYFYEENAMAAAKAEIDKK